MSQFFGYQLPRAMHPEVRRPGEGRLRAGRAGALPQEVFAIFQREYLEILHPYHLLTYRIFEENAGQGQVMVDFEGVIRTHRVNKEVMGRGNGPIDLLQRPAGLGADGIRVCLLQRARGGHRRRFQGGQLYPAPPRGRDVFLAWAWTATSALLPSRGFSAPSTGTRFADRLPESRHRKKAGIRQGMPAFMQGERLICQLAHRQKDPHPSTGWWAR